MTLDNELFHICFCVAKVWSVWSLPPQQVVMVRACWKQGQYHVNILRTHLHRPVYMTMIAMMITISLNKVRISSKSLAYNTNIAYQTNTVKARNGYSNLNCYICLAFIEDSLHPSFKRALIWERLGPVYIWRLHYCHIYDSCWWGHLTVVFLWSI